MTYGENAGIIRDELAELLRMHRVQQRLGGPGVFGRAEFTTTTERKEMGHLLQRYRAACLNWCRQALDATRPKTDRHRPTGTEATRLSLVESMCNKLELAAESGPDGAPLLELLDIEHGFDLLQRWQRVARAAVLGEHDFTRDVNLGMLRPEQARVVVKDAADVIRGVAVLDERYRHIPAWRQIQRRVPLVREATLISNSIGILPCDLSVDRLGWRPQPSIISPVPPGVAGAVAAQRNVLTDLAHFPLALNLRRVLLAQARVSSEAARHAKVAAPDLVDRILDRQEVYRRLLAQSRNLGGVIGDGRVAVAQSVIAGSRLAGSVPGAAGADEALDRLQRLSTHIDARIASTIEYGIHERLYLVSAKVPAIAARPAGAVYAQRQQWEPADRLRDLTRTIRTDLRPPTSVQPSTPPTARPSREAYRAALFHRSTPRIPDR